MQNYFISSLLFAAKFFCHLFFPSVLSFFLSSSEISVLLLLLLLLLLWQHQQLWQNLRRSTSFLTFNVQMNCRSMNPSWLITVRIRTLFSPFFFSFFFSFYILVLFSFPIIMNWKKEIDEFWKFLFLVFFPGFNWQ